MRVATVAYGLKPLALAQSISSEEVGGGLGGFAGALEAGELEGSGAAGDGEGVVQHGAGRALARGGAGGEEFEAFAVPCDPCAGEG